MCLDSTARARQTTLQWFFGRERGGNPMRKPIRVAIVLAAVAIVALFLATPFYGSTASAASETRAAPLIYTVGGQDQMKTRNWLPSIANDVWTSDVLGRVYDTVGQTHPVTDELVPYIIKGVDVRNQFVRHGVRLAHSVIDPAEHVRRPHVVRDAGQPVPRLHLVLPADGVNQWCRARLAGRARRRSIERRGQKECDDCYGR